MKAKSYLGIVDWGIGGVSIYKLIKSRLGNVPVIYFSDTWVTPYGKMPRRELISRLNTLIVFLRAQGVTHLVVGCNAASTVVSFLSVDEMKVADVIESAIRVTGKMCPARLALIGGRRTVLSGVYRRAFAALGIKVAQRVAQPLSSLIESGDVSSPDLREQCRKILSPIKTCSHLLLACTHYPAIIPVLKDYVSKETVFIDPVGELVRKIEQWKLPTGGADRFLTSGDPEKMKNAAFKVFGTKIKTVERITI